MTDERLARLVALTQGAQKIADESTRFGVLARYELSRSTGLSLQGVDFALKRCLEHGVNRSTLSALVRQTKTIPRAHVLLSANVFVATFRAIALALCQSSKVSVRASTREPVMARLLHEASQGAFDLQDELSPLPGEHLWAYGTDDTIESLKKTLSPGVYLHAHGAGLGVAVLVESEDSRQPDLPAAVEGLVLDTIVFDQRGCLSPRIVLVEGKRSFAETVCDLLVSNLEKWEKAVPLGALDKNEEADRLRFFSTVNYVGSSVQAGQGMVFLDPVTERLSIPPVGRNLHVTVTRDAFPLLCKLGTMLTTVGLHNAELLPGRLREVIGPRRYVGLGDMQRPAFDGPVDLRQGFTSELL